MRIRQLSLLTLFLGLAELSAGQTPSAPPFDPSSFDKHQGKWTRAWVEKRLGTYLTKGEEIRKNFELTDQVFKLYLDSQKEKRETPFFTLRLARENSKSRATQAKALSLKGRKIALDPGHVGGAALSRIELKYTDMIPSEENGVPSGIFFDEGTLTYLTARHLQKLLEAKGARVLVSRKAIGASVYPMDFQTWMKAPESFESEEQKAWALSEPLWKPFISLYNNLDLRERAKQINEFQPDLTLILHMNSCGLKDKDAEGRDFGTALNFNMAFVPGAFVSGELKNEVVGENFLHLLLEADLDASQRFSKLIVQELSRAVNVPPIDPGSFQTARFSGASLALPAPGVYARNLVLTREIRSPLCYAEALCQDNFEESKRLFEKNTKIDGHPTTQRVVQIAQAYLAAIEAYFRREDG